MLLTREQFKRGLELQLDGFDKDEACEELLRLWDQEAEKDDPAFLLYFHFAVETGLREPG